MADISQMTFSNVFFFNDNVWISIWISLKFVPKGPINKIPALFQIMAWRRPGDKPLSEAMLVSLLTHRCVTRPQWVILLSAMVFMIYRMHYTVSSRFRKKKKHANSLICCSNIYIWTWFPRLSTVCNLSCTSDLSPKIRLERFHSEPIGSDRNSTPVLVKIFTCALQHIACHI